VTDLEREIHEWLVSAERVLLLRVGPAGSGDLLVDWIRTAVERSVGAIVP
jgi:hypothetical protein